MNLCSKRGTQFNSSPKTDPLLGGKLLLGLGSFGGAPSVNLQNRCRVLGFDAGPLIVVNQLAQSKGWVQPESKHAIVENGPSKGPL